MGVSFFAALLYGGTTPMSCWAERSEDETSRAKKHCVQDSSHSFRMTNGVPNKPISLGFVGDPVVLSYRDVENIECIFFVKKYQFCFCLFGVLALTKIIVCQKNDNFAKTCWFLFDYLCRIIIQSKWQVNDVDVVCMSKN